MKKLIAILVVFAMVAGAAFAVDLSAEAIGAFTVAEGTTQKVNDETPDPGAGGTMTRIRLGGSAESEDGKFGGWVRLNASGYGDLDENGGAIKAWGIAWWKPIDQLKLQIGTNGDDGEFGLEGVTGWGYYAMANESITNNGNTWGGGVVDGAIFRNAFYGGFNKGTMLVLTPVEGLAINIGIPNFDGDKAEYVYKRTNAQIAYSAEGLGTFAFTYKGGAGFNKGVDSTSKQKETDYYYEDPANPGDYLPVFIDEDEGGVDGTNEASAIFIYAGLNMIEGLSIDLGFGYTMKLEGVQPPMAIGLGLEYSTDSFGVKFRGLAQLGANKEHDKYEQTDIVVDVMPYFKIDDNLNFFLSTGLGMNMTKDDNFMGWHVQPYIVVGNQWAAAFYAGFRLESPIVGKDDDSYVNWSIPLGISMSF